MKLHNLLFIVIALCFSVMAVAADVAPDPKATQLSAQEAKAKADLDNQLNSALKTTTDRVNALSKDEKEKLLSDLNHPDGKTVGQGVAAFGEELGKGLSGAVKELGVTFNEFANSRVGMIATFIILWHFVGKAVLWFIFICILLKGSMKAVRSIWGEFNEKGKFVKLDLGKNEISDQMAFGVWVLLATVLVSCVIGAAVNF